jgi:hypothetical protein
MVEHYGSELDQHIAIAGMRRLSVKETLEYLKNQGFEISDKTLYNRKKKSSKILKFKVDSVIEDIAERFIKHLEMMEYLQKCLLEDVEQTSDVNLRLKLFKEIKANESIISELHVRIPEMVKKQIESYKNFPANKILTKEDHEKQKLENRIDELQNEPFLTLPDVSLLNNYKDLLEEIEKKK